MIWRSLSHRYVKDHSAKDHDAAIGGCGEKQRFVLRRALNREPSIAPHLSGGFKGGAGGVKFNKAAFSEVGKRLVHFPVSSLATAAIASQSA
jgi:hypothetical protein